MPPSIAVDSTTITTGAGNWKWAQFRGEKAGVKLHVSFDVKTMTPICVEESVASQHDSKKASQLVTMKRAIYICDRAYAKYDRMDELHGEDKFFVIRLKKNAVTRDERICSVPTKESFVREDWIARLGEEVNGTIHPFRLVTFQDLEGHEIRVVTNLYDVSAEIGSVIGYNLERTQRWLRYSKVYLGLFLFFSLISIVECYISIYYLNAVEREYFLATIITAPSIFLFCLSNPLLGKGSYLSKIGSKSVGVYVIHVFFIKLTIHISLLLKMREVIDMSIIWQIVYTPLVFIIAYIAYENLQVVKRFFVRKESDPAQKTLLSQNN
ncbi:transposase [Thermoactinomyces sp. DSM 45891]|uniref:transposase n=1 Tax=Thermoactinomyces sp. DSM 45891 TaxID=1761907 RepID=UPI0009319FE1|nr:transposase [Thermoactinomyces sp. DSM 45891]